MKVIFKINPIKTLFLSTVAGALVLSGCNIRFNRNYFPNEDVAAFAWSLSNPGEGATSAIDSPTVSLDVLADLEQYENAVIKIWVNDPVCTPLAEIVSGSVTAGLFSDTPTVPSEGLNTFYFTITPSGGSESACASTALAYTLRLPRFNFARSFYSVSEDTTLVGSSITITRDNTEIASQVRLDTFDVTADAGTNYQTLSKTYSFPVGVSSVAVDESDFNILDDGVETGDLWLKMKLTPVTGGLNGDEAQSTLNILDSGDSRKYTFGQALYSVSENAGSVTLTVQKVNTFLASSVDVAFVNGSATGGVDFTAGTQTLNFAAGEDEKTITVPIFDNGTSGDSRSFYAHFVAADASNLGRSQAVTKIRILDNDDTTVCDSANDNLATNDGFGGGVGSIGDPYLICSLSQFARISTQATAYFKLMADLDASPDIDSDPVTGGVQPLQPLASFQGNLEAGEHTIDNYTFDTSGGSQGLFGIWTAPSNGSRTLNALNLINARIMSAIDSGILTRKNGTLALFPVIMKNTLVSGYLRADHGGLFGSELHYGSTVGAIATLQNNLSAGTLVTSTDLVGGHFGNFTGNADSPVGTMDHLYNTANIVASAGDDLGGIIGKINPTLTTGAISFSDLESHGNIFADSGSSLYLGGLFGRIITALSVSVTDSSNTGHVSGYRYLGGIAGIMIPNTNTTDTLDGNTNWGAVLGDIAVGGILGKVNSQAGGPSVANITNSTNYGTLKAVGPSVGGIVGQLYSGFSDITFQVASNTNFSSLSNSATSAGGIVGTVLGDGASLNQVFQVTDNQNDGSLAGGAVDNRGGIIGQVNLNSTGSSTIEASRNINTATVEGANFVGGVVGSLVLSAGSTTNRIIITDNRGDGQVGGTAVTGGILGQVTVSGGLDYSFDCNSNTVNSNVTVGAGGRGGGLIGAGSLGATGGTSTVSILSNMIDRHVTVSGPEHLGGFVGSLTGGSAAAVLTGTFDSNVSDANVTGADTAGVCGGIIGELSPGDQSYWTISNSEAAGEISCAGPNSGGLIGLLTTSDAALDVGKVTISDSLSGGIGNISGTKFVGGLIGYAALYRGFDLDILDSHSDGDVNATAELGVGGIAGIITMSGGAGVGLSRLSISDSYATGSIYGAATGVITLAGGGAGGIMGGLGTSSANQGVSISRVYATGNVESGGALTGGLIGVYVATSAAAGPLLDINNSYASGSTLKVAAGSGNLGGLIGTFSATNVNNDISIFNSYVSSTLVAVISPVGTVGGLVGAFSGAASSAHLTLTDSFYRLDAGTTPDVGGGTQTLNRTTAQMHNPATFSGAGWDIGDINASTIWLDPNGLSFPTLK